jgi:hypothetical protein
MAQFEPLLWERRPRRRRARILGSNRSPINFRSEFSAHPPGRLGRQLLAEVETYLAFFALAHESTSDKR